MSKNRSTWSTLLAIVLAMVVMAGLAVTAFAVTDGEHVGNEYPDATIQQLIAALESGVLESGINYDVDGNGIVEKDDLKYLNGELADEGDLLDQLTEESKAGLQSLIVKGDSTRALAMTGMQSITLDFAAPVDLGSAEKLLIDTFWTSGNGGSFQVVFLSGDKETAPVTVTAGQAGWSAVEVPFDDPTGVIVGNVTGIRIILDEGDTTYFDNFRLEGASDRVKVTADGQVYRPVAGTTYGELPTPVKTFYTFGGWMLNGNAVEASAQIENDAVLEAKWTLVASDDSTVTVADKGNNAFDLTMDGAYRQIRFDFMLKSGDFYMSYADGDDIGYNNPVVTIVDVNGNAVSQTKVQPGQWYTAFIYGGSVKAVNGTITEIHDGARMATSGTLTISDGVQMQVRNLETLTGQFGVRVFGPSPTLWQMTDSTTVVDGKPVNGYNYHKQQAAEWGSHWTFDVYAGRYTEMTFELYIYELNGEAANGQVTGLNFTTAASGSGKLTTPVVYDMDGNQVTTANVKAGTWYKVKMSMAGASNTHYLYSTVSKGDEAKAGTYKAYIANVNFVGDGTMIDNLSPATSVTVDKAGTDGTFVTTPVTRDTDRGTYRVAGTSAKWADRVIRVSRNDDTKELIQLDFRFVTSKDADGKDVAPTLVASTGVSGTLTQAQYIILDENDAPVTTLQTGKWYRMFINANGGNVFGLVPAVSGEVELQVEGLDTFHTDELPAAMVSAGGNMSAVLTRFGKLQYIYAGNGANTVTITLNSDLYKQIRFAAKSDSAISLTGAAMNTTGSGEWKNVVIYNDGGNLPTTLTLNVGEGTLVIKDLVAYTEADPAKKTESDIFRGLYDDEMMISGFLGPREEEHFYIARSDQKSNAYASLARDDIFKLIADVGINYISDNGVNYSGAGKENAQHILRLAAKYGINYFASATDVVEIGVKTGTQSVNYPSFLNPHDQVIYKSTIASADAIKAKLQKLYQYESFGGLYLKDEPTSDLFDEIQDAVTKINQAKQEMGNVTLNQYVNLLTWYNTTGALTNFQDYTSPAGGTAGINNTAITWEEYLKASVLDTGMNYFSFDIYPFNTDGLNSSFLNYLGMANYVAMNQTGTPWMGYAQVGGGVPGYNADKAIATEAELNWDVNAMLAFGAKGILYYINVTPPYAPYDTSSGMDPHSLIDASGTPTDYYGYVMDINAQIQAIDHVLMKSQHLGVIVNGSGACGYSESTGKTTLLNTTSELGTVKLSSVSGTVLIGAFDYNGQTALLVMNNTTDNDGVADSITLNFTGAYSYEVIQDAVTAMSMGTSLNLSLLPGRCALVVVHDNLASTQASFAGAEVTEEAKTVYVDFPYGELPAPEREGYLFAGWFTDETYTTQVTAETVVTKSEAHTLYAKWLELCTVSFDLNYTDAGENPAAITPIKGDTYGDLPVPEREGYTFLGWYTDTGYTQAVASSTVATESRTLYAKWSDIRLNPGNAAVITKDVLYTEEGAIFNYKATTTVTAGENQVLKMPLPASTYKGFTMKIRFNECTQADGTEKVYIRPVSTSGNVYLNYKWLDENGVEVAEADRKIGQWYTFVATMPNSATTSNVWIYLGNLATQNLTKLDISIKDLVGITDQMATVTLNMNYDGVASRTVLTSKGTTVAELPVPERDGYQFFGWFTSASGLTPVANSTAIDGDKTLYAFWNVDPAIWGGTFTFIAPNYGYYARVTAEQVDGETVLKYVNQNVGTNTGVDASVRRIQFNANAAAGDIISLKVKIASVKNAAAGTSPDTSTIAVHNASGTKLATVFIDENGLAVKETELKVGSWYTLHFVSDGSGNYQFRPFAAGGDDGVFYAKDICVNHLETAPITLGVNRTDISSIFPVKIGDETVVVYRTFSRTANANEYESRMFIAAPHSADEIIRMKVMITSVTDADGNPSDDRKLVVHTKGGAPTYAATFKDENGNTVANSELELGKWYTMSWTGDGSEYYSIWSFTGAINGIVMMKDFEVAPPEATVSFNLNYEGAEAPTTVTVVKGQSVGDKLLTPVREGYLFNGWSTSKYGWGMGNAFTADTAVSADQTVYATWTIDPDVFGYTFSYPNGTGTYYADITIEEESGKTAIKYSNVGKDNHAYVTADVRKVMLHITASAGDVVSMKLKVPTGSTAGTKFVICNASGTELTTVFTDAQGNIAENGNLTLGQWYTLSWVSDGTINYQIRPFEANSASGSFYMADINVISFTYTAAEGKYYAQISRDVMDGEAVSKYTNTNVHSAVYPKHRKVYINIAHQLGDTISMKVMLGDVSNVSGTNLTTNTLAIHPKDSDTPLAVTFKDEQGNVVADGELTEGVWYTMTFKGSGISTYDIRPFKNAGDTGVFYLKNIQVIEPQMEDDDFNPTLRFAITSDTHLFNRYQGSATQEAHLANLFTVSYGYARRSAAYKNLDAVLVAGDISEGDAGEFVMFKDIVDANIKEGTQLIVGMGNHDFRGGLDPAAWTEDAAKQLEAAFKTTFGLESADQHVVINGYHFISLSPNAENLGNNVGESYSEAKLAWLEAEIQEAIADDATKPVFVMQHHHPSGTVYGSGAAGGKQADLFNLLSKYPQVVDFSGHSHYPVNDPRNVWQGAFTAIGTGTLFYVGLDINGGPTGVYPDGYQGDYSTSGSKNGADYGVFQIIEVNAENDIRVIVYDLRSFEELCRFVIENPAIPANHVTNEQKAEASVVPEFASDAELEMRDVDGVKYVYVPQAVSTEVIESYRAKVTVDGVTTTYYGLSGYVYPTQPEVVSIKIGQLDLNKSYRIEVVAVNAYGKESTVPLVLASVPVAEVTFDLNYEGAPAYNEVIHVTEGSAYGTLPTPTRKYHTFDGWYTDAVCSGEAVTAQTTASNSHTLYAKWTFDAAAAGLEFTYASGIGTYYGNVTAIEVDGNVVFKHYVRPHTEPTAASDRRVHLNLANTEKQAISMQVYFAECSNTPSIKIWRGDGSASNAAYAVHYIVTDAEGNVYDPHNLELNKWYTVTWLAAGAPSYMVMPFEGESTNGTYYMKNITVTTVEDPLSANYYAWPAPFAAGDETHYWVHVRAPYDAQINDRYVVLKSDAAAGDTISFKMKATEINNNGTSDLIIKNASGTAMTTSIVDENGNSVNATEMQLNQWYTVSWVADGSATYRIHAFAGVKVDGNYFIKDIISNKPVVETFDVTFDLNYEGAGEGPEAITRAEGAAYGTLPTPTRAQTRTTTSGGYTFYYGFAGWYTNAECTGEAVKPTDVVTEARPLYAKWEKAILMPRATNSVYSDPTLQYIEGEWVYVYANNGTTKTSAEQERLNLHLPEKIAYAVSYKVMLTNETDAALFYTDSGNLGVDIYDANGILLYKRNYKNGGTTTQVTLEEGKWYTIVHANRDSSTYYLTGTDYFGLGVYGDGEGGATMYVKDIEIATENAPSTAAVDVYTNNVSLYPNRNLRVIDGEWAWVFAGNQAQTTQSGRFLRFNIKTGPVSKVTFKLMADNCTGDVVLNYAQVGSAAVTFKDPDGNTVDWDKLQTGVWYDCVFTRATAMAAAADWSIGYFGTGTGGMDIYFKDIQLVPAE